MKLNEYLANAAILPPSAPDTPSVGYPSLGDQQTGVRATLVGDYWYYQVQQEIANLLSAAAVTAASADLTQLGQAVLALGAGNLQVADAAALRLVDLKACIHVAQTLGALTAGDGGGGMWRWDASSTAADNTGTVILPTAHSGAGRWLRVYSDTVVNGAWWGPSNGTNDSATLQAILDTAAPCVRLGAAQYIISGTVTCSTPGQRIDLAGTTLYLKSSAASGGMLIVSGPGAIVENGTIDGNRANNFPGNANWSLSYGIKATADRITVRRMRFQAIFGSATVATANAVTIIDNEIDGCSGWAIYCTAVVAQANMTGHMIARNRITNGINISAWGAGSAAIVLQASINGNYWIKNSKIIDNICIDGCISPSLNTLVSGNTVTNGPNNGARMGITEGYGVIATGNHLDVIAYGVEIIGPNATVIGNYIRTSDSQGYGVIVTSAYGSKAKIVGNDIETSAGGPGVGTYLSSGETIVRVTSGGSGYVNGETVSVLAQDGSGSGATGKVWVTSGSVIDMRLIGYGSGYTSGEAVNIVSSLSGTGATGTIIVSPAVEDVIISDNRISVDHGYGLSFNGKISGVVIAGNTVKNISSTILASDSAIKYIDPYQDFRANISGNRFYRFYKPSIIISATSSITVSNLTVRDNTWYDNQSTAYLSSWRLDVSTYIRLGDGVSLTGNRWITGTTSPYDRFDMLDGGKNIISYETKTWSTPENNLAGGIGSRFVSLSTGGIYKKTTQSHAGYLYATGDTLSIVADDGSGAGATGSALVVGGLLTGVTVIAGGAGYTDGELVNVIATSGSGWGGQGTAQVTGGAITGVLFNNGWVAL